MSPRFSAAVVARYEEALIRRCLESVAWCDERILIDMDSSDHTRELVTLFAFSRFETAAKRSEAARYLREGDATVRRLGSLPRLAAALTGDGFRRLWARRSVR